MTNVSKLDNDYLNSTSMTYLNNWNTRAVVDAVFLAGVGTLEGLIGITTNIINCLVFRRQGLRDRMNLCLFSLSMVDCLYNAINFTIFALPFIVRFHDIFLYEAYTSTLTGSLMGVLRGCSLTSGCINMAIAVDTCVCVVLPHRAASLVRTKTMMLLLVTCFLFIQSCFVIVPFSYGFSKVAIGDRVQLIYIGTKFLEENRLFIYFFLNVFLETVGPFINFTVVSAATIVTVKVLTAGMRWRENTSNISTNLQSRQVALTKMLTMIAFVFVIVKFPSVLFQVSLWINLTNSGEPSSQEKFFIASSVIYSLCQVNGSINFFIYFYRSSRFRRELHKMFPNLTFRQAKSITNMETMMTMTTDAGH